MIALGASLILKRCPHCSIANPNLPTLHAMSTQGANEQLKRLWRFYVCQTCGGVISAWSYRDGGEVDEYFPTNKIVQNDIPERPANYLSQAIESVHAPAGAIMLSASAVDAMLKIKGYKDGSLYARVDKAVENHLITKEMGLWAHEIRLDANDERHADETAPMPTKNDAEKCIDFALALAEYMFVLPSRITRGLKKIA
jgi:hypothetical protein